MNRIGTMWTTEERKSQAGCNREWKLILSEEGRKGGKERAHAEIDSVTCNIEIKNSPPSNKYYNHENLSGGKKCE